MTALSVVCWGELLWDVFPDARRLGGAAANVAYHVAALGDRARLVSRVGDDEAGHAAIAELAAHGVDTSLIQIDPQHATGRVDITVQDGEPRYAIAEQAAWDRITLDDAAREAVQSADVLVYGTLAQRTVLGQGALADALAATRPACLRLCDLNVRPPFATEAVIDGAIARATAVKLNEHEAQRLCDATGTRDAIATLLDRGVTLVALTRGARGATLATRTERVEHAGFPASSADGDSVGAGDAFAAVIAHCLPRGVALAELVERANRYAAHVASKRGAMPVV